MARPIEVPFVDEYGEDRVIHRRVGGGFSVKRNELTPILALNAEVSRRIGARVRELRIERGLSLTELAHRIGATSGHPKNRMWALENPGQRGTGEQYGGMRLGTLYALALALEVDVCDLMPSASEVGTAKLGSRTSVVVKSA